MIRDLRTILDGWDFEPGKISVRKIIGREGREKIQTRIDCGVLQLECDGRPDNQRPRSCESLLEYHEQRLREHVHVFGNDEEFVLSPEQCRELRHESYLYYQRYLALFVLEEFSGVERDTARNLRVIDFCRRFAVTEYDRLALERQRPYVTMMNARARAYIAVNADRHDEALRIVDEGVEALLKLVGGDSGDAPISTSETNTLHALRDEILQQMPPDAPTKLRADLALAIECEDYEQAARLRDRISALGIPTPEHPAKTSHEPG